MKTIKVINKITNENCEVIQYTGNYGDVINFIGAPDNVWFINEDFYINTKSNLIEVAKYRDYIVKHDNGTCHVCKCDSIFNSYKKI